MSRAENSAPPTSRLENAQKRPVSVLGIASAIPSNTSEKQHATSLNSFSIMQLYFRRNYLKKQTFVAANKLAFTRSGIS